MRNLHFLRDKMGTSVILDTFTNWNFFLIHFLSCKFIGNYRKYIFPGEVSFICSPNIFKIRSRRKWDNLFPEVALICITNMLLGPKLSYNNVDNLLCFFVHIDIIISLHSITNCKFVIKLFLSQKIFCSAPDLRH